MKHLKKLSIFILMLLFTAFILCLCGCIPKPVAQHKDLTLPTLQEGQMAVIIKNSDDVYTTYTVNLSQKLATVADVLQHLANDCSMALEYTADDYGMYLSNVGGLVPDASKNQFVAFFTTVEGCKGSWAGVPSYNLGEVSIVSAGVGVSQTPAQSKSIAYFEISTY